MTKRNWVYLDRDELWCLAGAYIQIRKGDVQDNSRPGITAYHYGTNIIYHGTNPIESHRTLSDAMRRAEILADELASNVIYPNG